MQNVMRPAYIGRRKYLHYLTYDWPTSLKTLVAGPTQSYLYIKGHYGMPERGMASLGENSALWSVDEESKA